jgi:hypothetical protein
VTAGRRARAAVKAANAAGTVTAAQVLHGHVTLDLECLDRVYLNGYVPNLQVGGQVVTFLTQHLGNPVPSPALFNPIGERFRAAVDRFAAANGSRWCGSARTSAKPRSCALPGSGPGGRTAWGGGGRGGAGVPAGVQRPPAQDRPLPLTAADRAAGYWWELSMRQVEVSRTLVWTPPATPARSSRRSSKTTWGSAGPTRSRSSSTGKSVAPPRQALRPAWSPAAWRSPSTASTSTPASSSTSRRAARSGWRPSATPPATWGQPAPGASGCAPGPLRGLLHQAPRPAPGPLLAADRPPAPPALRDALTVIDQAVRDDIRHAHLKAA